MFHHKVEDEVKYGRQVYFHSRKKGSHRWNTCVFLDDNGRYSAVFRHLYSKKVDGVKKDFVQHERVVSANDAASFSQVEFPEMRDAQTLKESDFFRALI
ncbi:antirestriction protein ArdR (plasmid) [Xenorhabdus stockiae]|uniref:antirestriction protein ArdR n=1 Tax=Xenorhabdus stockiae TaxID=351614 RepID=UPI003CEB6F8A